MALRSSFTVLAVRSVLAFSIAIGGAGMACTTNTVFEHRPGPVGDPDGGVTVDPGSDVDAGVDSGPTDFVFKPAPAGTFAQGVSAGGSVVKSPKVMPIVFASDDAKAQLTDFATKLATTTYWGKISSEYGVGALTAKPAVTLTEAAPTSIDDSEIETWLASKFTTDSADFGAPDSNTLYEIFYPAGTTITQGGQSSCQSFGGYHFETQANGVPISYAVLPRCDAFIPGLSSFEGTTLSASHEVLEWATDPFPETSPAYMSVDDDHAVWGRVFLGELGDLCTQMPGIPTSPSDLGYVVQRTWSNASAKAGHHPCVPVAGDPYYTAFPTKPETIAVNLFGQQATTKGFKVGVGQSKTIDLTMYSDAATDAWTVQVLDLTQLTGAPEEFTYSLDKMEGRAGDTLKLTITGVKPAEQGQGFVILSTIGNGGNLWPVWVTN
jgi:hypothetical protein